MSYTKVPFEKVDLTGGFFAARQKLNRDVTLYAVRDRFQDTGRFDAFRFEWKEGDPNKPHIFWDSDIAKWLESAAFILSKERDDALEAYIDNIVDLIEKHRLPDGYFNTYFEMIEPDNRFSVRDAHELYCAGHLIEAAVAYYKATGKNKFLNLMCDYAAYIERAFVTEKTAKYTTPGHEEIELALIKLYGVTGNEKHLGLARHFIDARGQADSEEATPTPLIYSQAHMPVREQREAVGHCVRACYLYAAMADLARIDSDEELLTACNALFDNIVNRRMYVTGGIGSASNGEKFTVDWDLPNAVAYSETCAAISLCYFAQRMTLAEPDGRYADIVEKTLFNSVISGLSLDGKSFFYENPLEINRFGRICAEAAEEKRHYPITQRVEVFGCSCCPPNITRLMASLGDYIYTFSDDTLFVHQYFANTADIEHGGIVTKVSLSGDYPNSGALTLKLNGGFVNAALRIPSWCSDFTLTLDGKTVQAPVKNGYVYVAAGGACEISLTLDIRPKLYFANACLYNNRGRAALAVGPVLYCLEGVDNGENLDALTLTLPLRARCVPDASLGVCRCEAEGMRLDNKALYFEADGAESTPVTLKYIPYFAFANRGESDMRVWVPVC